MRVFIFIIGLYLMLVFFASPSFAAEKVAENSAVLENPQKTNDLRVEKLKFFLQQYDSPLVTQASVFVELADKYSLDWKLVASIAGVESTFGKRTPKNSYNAWGFGIPTGRENGIVFANWTEGIETVSQTLKEKYIDRGADTPYKMGPIYAPPSKTWPSKVAYFMEKIEETTPKPQLSI